MSVRPPAVAGLFYPGNAAELRRDVTAYLNEANVDPQPAQTRAIVCPHAGYRYSGFTAAHAFARVRGMAPRRVVLVGRSHHHFFAGISVWPSGALASPLGESPVDADFTAHLAVGFPVATPRMHDKEHALEVMLPFVQMLFPGVPVAALLFGDEPSSFAVEVGERLAGTLGNDDLLVLSTDLSHYLSEREANEIDRRSVDAVITGDHTTFARAARNQEISLCGATAVEAGMTCMEMRGVTTRRLLDYRTSAWASGDTTRVVGYAAISFAQG